MTMPLKSIFCQEQTDWSAYCSYSLLAKMTATRTHLSGRLIFSDVGSFIVLLGVNLIRTKGQNHWIGLIFQTKLYHFLASATYIIIQK